MRTPVLFIVFNRPHHTRRVFEAIRGARPPRLYVSADGPRSDRPGEQRLCEEVRTIATAVDWPCEVSVRSSPHNLGCKIGESTAMDWFFQQEEEGIILEDDTLPVSGFFPFCEELLGLYRHDARVFSISGTNYVARDFPLSHSYLFSRYADYWGWAGWRRSWQSYDVNMSAWPTWRDSHGIGHISEGDALFERYWRAIFDDTHAGIIDTWDYQRLFTMWQHDGLSIFPSNNMVENLGFGADATHTRKAAPAWLSEATITDPAFPLVHPLEVRTVPGFDRHFGRKMFDISRAGVTKRFVTRNAVARHIRHWLTTS